MPHHLFDVVEPNEAFDAARYAALARAALADIAARGRRALVVGGTGLYLKALRVGLFAGPGADAALRARLNAEEAVAPGTLQARLAQVDPTTAARLALRDRVRLVRALEVYELTGRPLSDWHRQRFRRLRRVPVAQRPPGELVHLEGAHQAHPIAHRQARRGRRVHLRQPRPQRPRRRRLLGVQPRPQRRIRRRPGEQADAQRLQIEPGAADDDLSLIHI